jgi:hypothetical protein
LLPSETQLRKAIVPREKLARGEKSRDFKKSRLLNFDVALGARPDDSTKSSMRIEDQSR